MSDRPPESPDQNSDPQPTGGWRKPPVPGAWRKPEKPETPAWRKVVPALPTDMPKEPQEGGQWHVPADDDTIYTPEDEVEVLPPEDVLTGRQSASSERLEPATALPPEELIQQAAAASGETETRSEPETLGAPEDLIYQLEHIDTQDDDFNQPKMSELIALANLAETSMDVEITPGEDEEISEALSQATEAGEESDELSLDDMLAPAEKLAEQVTQPTDTFDQTQGFDDPGEYARRQLEQFGDDEETEADDMAFGGTDDSGIGDPGEYARRQLEQFGEGEPAAEAPEQSQQVLALNEREEELARRFLDTQDQVYTLRQQMQNGQITPEQFRDALRGLMIQDDDQVWWMMGVETDTWYRSQGDEWVPAMPEVLQKYQRAQPTSGVDPNSVVREPLEQLTEPSIPTPSAADYGQQTIADDYGQPTQYGTGEEIRLDENGMPLPRQVPIDDPYATVPNQNVFDAEFIGDQNATVPSAAASAYAPVAPGVETPFPQEGELDIEEEYYPEAVARQRQSTTRRVVLLAVAGLTLIFLVGAVFVGAGLVWYSGIVDQYEEQIVALANYEPEFRSVTVLDRNGEQIATLTREGDDRREVPLGDVSPYFIHAILSTENPTFYADSGWDFFSIMEAFWQNLFSGEVTTGTNSITQDVAAELVIRSSESDDQARLHEVIVAGELTRRYTKNELLELYINELNFGNQTYGIEAASQFYFNKPAIDLNLPEAAMLATIPASPTDNEPVNNKEVAIDNMRIMMIGMGSVGCLQFQHAPYQETPFCIDQELLESDEVILDTARAQTTRFLPREFADEFPHFLQMVRGRLEAYYGSTELYRAGYTVRTTLDAELQRFAQEQLANYIDSGPVAGRGVNTGSIMVTDPRDCSILTMVGSPDFNNEEIGGQVNGALSWNQPGNAITPMVYMTAMQGVDRNGNGAIEQNEYFTPATIMWDVETTWDLQTGLYTPNNFDGTYHGPRSVRNALQNSYDIPALKAFEFTGAEAFVNTSQQMGLTFRSDAQFTLATGIGATDVRLYDMMVAYGAIASGGQRCEFIASDDFSPPLRAIIEVTTDSGLEVPLPFTGQTVQAVQPGNAFLMQHMLADDNARQEEFGLNSAMTITGPNLPDNFVGAKSGTSGTRTQAFDLWTMGFTTNRVVGVWLGHHENAALGGSNNDPTTGARFAAPLWNSIMRSALQETSPTTFQPRANGQIASGQVCAATGTAVGDGCPSVRNEIWASSQPPMPFDMMVPTLAIDSWTGLAYNTNCPGNQISGRFLRVMVPSDIYALNYINNTQPGIQWAESLGLPARQVSLAPSACDLDTPIPTVQIAGPNGGETVRDVISITGQVAGELFQQYQLQYQPEGSDQFFGIGDPVTQQQPTANSTLGTWDTRTVPNGRYVLRLVVFSTEGGFVERLVQPLIVNNPEPTAVPTVPPTGIPPAISPVPVDPLLPATETPIAPINGTTGNVPPVGGNDPQPMPAPTDGLGG